MVDRNITSLTIGSRKKLGTYFENNFKENNKQNIFQTNYNDAARKMSSKNKKLIKKNSGGGFRNKKPPCLYIPTKQEEELSVTATTSDRSKAKLDLFARTPESLNYKPTKNENGSFLNLMMTQSSPASSSKASGAGILDNYIADSPMGKLFSQFADGEILNNNNNNNNINIDTNYHYNNNNGGGGNGIVSDEVKSNCVEKELFLNSNDGFNLFSPSTAMDKSNSNAISPSSYFAYQMQLTPKTLKKKTTSMFHQNKKQETTRVLIDKTAIKTKKKPRKRKSVTKNVNKSSSSSKNDVVLTNPDRVWKLVSKHKKLKEIKDINLTVNSKTRREQWSNFLPDRMYSSLKYEIKLTATGKELMSMPFLLAKIVVMDAKTNQIKKKGGKDVLKLTTEGALTLSSDGTNLKCLLKVQFIPGLSYHQEKKEYIFQIHYFERQDIKNPILIKQSAPFRIYARKPNSTKTKKKRKNSTIKEPVNSKRKKLKKDSNFNEFLSRLDELVKVNLKLNHSEKQLAMNLVAQRLLNLNNSSNQQQQQQQQFQGLFGGMNTMFPTDVSSQISLNPDLFYGS